MFKLIYNRLFYKYINNYYKLLNYYYIFKLNNFIIIKLKDLNYILKILIILFLI